MPIGAGLFAAGAWPAGFGVPETQGATPNSPLPDPNTGLSLTGRLIDPTTNDYVMQADGRLQGMPTVPQLVLIAIKSIDTSGLQEKGRNFRSVLSTLVQNALANLVAQKLVRIRQLVVLSERDAGLASVDWVDLTTGTPGQSIIGGISQ